MRFFSQVLREFCNDSILLTCTASCMFVVFADNMSDLPWQARWAAVIIILFIVCVTSLWKFPTEKLMLALACSTFLFSVLLEELVLKNLSAYFKALGLLVVPVTFIIAIVIKNLFSLFRFSRRRY